MMAKEQLLNEGALPATIEARAVMGADNEDDDKWRRRLLMIQQAKGVAAVRLQTSHQQLVLIYND